MLNKHGVGTVYFGVKPNGIVCGMDVTESTLREVSRQDLADKIAKNIKTVQRALDSLGKKGYIKKKGKTRAIEWTVIDVNFH